MAYRRQAFERGLRAAGYEIAGMPRVSERIEPYDVLVIWNRYGHNHALALRFEACGARVIVAENGPLGREFLGEPWYAITLTNPLAGGFWPSGSPDRWDSFGVKICEWRKREKEIIILAQRGIGPNGIRQPDGWHQMARTYLSERGHQSRIREHPGERPQRVTLEQDLEHASAVVTWASGGAFKALLYGVPVFYGYSKWVGREAGDPLMNIGATPSYPDRIRTFRRLAWSMWRIPEIESGAPFRHLLG